MSAQSLINAAKNKTIGILKETAQGVKGLVEESGIAGVNKAITQELSSAIKVKGVSNTDDAYDTNNPLASNSDDAYSTTVNPDKIQATSTDSEPGPIGSITPPLEFEPGTTPAPWPNTLESFTSMNVISELAILSRQESIDPVTTYRSNGPSNIILRSGGGLGADKITTTYEDKLKTRLEYFIDEIEIDSLIAPNSKTQATNATTIRFTVIEPYSMGLFLQTLHVAAAELKYSSHIEANYLLTIKFQGFDENNNTRVAPYSTRMIPIMLTNVIFTVDQAGSKYEVTAIAANDIAFDDNVQTVKTDVTITGRTVSEILQSGAQSLATVINDRAQSLEAKNQVNQADQIVIMFPRTKTAINDVQEGTSNDSVVATAATEEGATNLDQLYQSVTSSGPDDNTLAPGDFTNFISSVSSTIEGRSRLGEAIKLFAETPTKFNEIATAEMVDDFLQPGQNPLGKPAFTYDSDAKIYRRDSIEVQIKKDLRNFVFKQGSRIQDIIEEILINSEYGKSLANQLENIQENEGMVNWFRIESQVYPVGSNKNRTGRDAHVYVYKVVPYKIHHSKFKAPTAASVGIDKLKKQAAKEYNYFYTGANKDILDLEVKFDYQYFTPLSADRNGVSASDRLGKQNSASNTDDAYETVTGQGQNNYYPSEGLKKTQEVVESETGKSGGTPYDDTKTRIARNFRDSIISGVDMVMVNMTIMGDPYYLSDSGLGNYNAPDTSFTNINEDGTMNYQNGEVDINLLFRSPIDYGEETMTFPEDFGIVKPYSGLYQVTLVRHSISQNQFKQELTLLRRQDQDNSEVSTGVGAVKTGTAAESMNDRQKTKTAPILEIPSPELSEDDRRSPF